LDEPDSGDAASAVGTGVVVRTEVDLCVDRRFDGADSPPNGSWSSATRSTRSAIARDGSIATFDSDRLLSDGWRPADA